MTYKEYLLAETKRRALLCVNSEELYFPEELIPFFFIGEGEEEVEQGAGDIAIAPICNNCAATVFVALLSSGAGRLREVEGEKVAYFPAYILRGLFDSGAVEVEHSFYSGFEELCKDLKANIPAEQQEELSTLPAAYKTPEEAKKELQEKLHLEPEKEPAEQDITSPDFVATERQSLFGYMFYKLLIESLPAEYRGKIELVSNLQEEEFYIKVKDKNLYRRVVELLKGFKGGESGLLLKEQEEAVLFVAYSPTTAAKLLEDIEAVGGIELRLFAITVLSLCRKLETLERELYVTTTRFLEQL